MKKKVIVMTCSTILLLSMVTTVLAIETPAPVVPAMGYGFCGGGYGLMWDQEGKLLEREAFESNLDKLIEDGFVRAEDKEYFLARYDRCEAYVGAASVRGGRCGMGRGMKCGW